MAYIDYLDGFSPFPLEWFSALCTILPKTLDFVLNGIYFTLDACVSCEFVYCWNGRQLFLQFPVLVTQLDFFLCHFEHDHKHLHIQWKRIEIRPHNWRGRRTHFIILGRIEPRKTQSKIIQKVHIVLVDVLPFPVNWQQTFSVVA